MVRRTWKPKEISKIQFTWKLPKSHYILESNPVHFSWFWSMWWSHSAKSKNTSAGVDKVAARRHAVPRKPSSLSEGRRIERATPEKSHPFGRKEGKGREKKERKTDTDRKRMSHPLDLILFLSIIEQTLKVALEPIAAVPPCKIGP
jgi:hypothetical protein